MCTGQDVLVKGLSLSIFALLQVTGCLQTEHGMEGEGLSQMQGALLPWTPFMDPFSAAGLTSSSPHSQEAIQLLLLEGDPSSRSSPETGTMVKKGVD